MNLLPSFVNGHLAVMKPLKGFERTSDRENVTSKTPTWTNPSIEVACANTRSAMAVTYSTTGDTPDANSPFRLSTVSGAAVVTVSV